MLKGLFRPIRRPSRGPSSEASGFTEQTKCAHGLREFSTPNAYFQCDLCRRQIGVWQTMWGCRECNYDECESCYETKRQTSSNQENMAQSLSPTGSSGDSRSKRQWICQVCTLENDLFRTECEVCLAKREEGKTGSSTVASLVCTICCDAPCEVAFLECGHCVTCERCANSLMSMAVKQCPICRTGLSKKPLRIYFA